MGLHSRFQLADNAGVEELEIDEMRQMAGLISSLTLFNFTGRNKPHKRALKS